ncbi:MAG: hypothetical protein HY271_15105 [Deltaproteobacteria bacterium]|nr:hypothetical protein [Deltaproteobacteria bacterium]
MRHKPNAAIEAMLEELKSAARTLGFEVREEELLREVGYRARSGACRVGATRVILLDRHAGADDRVEALCAALAGQDLERVFLSPALRVRLASRALRPTESPAG